MPVWFWLAIFITILFHYYTYLSTPINCKLHHRCYRTGFTPFPWPDRNQKRQMYRLRTKKKKKKGSADLDEDNFPINYKRATSLIPSAMPYLPVLRGVAPFWSPSSRPSFGLGRAGGVCFIVGGLLGSSL